MKKILLVSFYLEPCTMIGARRASYLANYLQKNKFKVIVLRADDIYYKNFCNFDSLAYNYKVHKIKKSFSLKINYYAWQIAFKKEIKRIVQNETISLIYFIGDPFYYFSLGVFFKNKYCIPYIIDFRDPWYQDIRLNKTNQKTIKQKLYSYLAKIDEKRAVENANLIVNVTEARTKIYRKYYKNVSDKKFITIQNGYDDSDLNVSIKNDKDINNKFLGEFNIGLSGKFCYYNPQSVELLLKTIQKHTANLNIIIHHWGDYENKFHSLVRKYNLSGNIRFYGREKYNIVVKSLRKMDLLVLNHRDNRSLGTKVYDYIYVNKPIAAFVPNKSEISILLKQFANHCIIQNENDLYRFIWKIYKQNIACLDRNIELKNFSRKKQFDYLLKYLEIIINN